MKSTKKEKKVIKHRRREVARALDRVITCFGAQLTEPEQNTLAGVFADEENALRHCEQGEIGKAISLLKEQEGAAIPWAIAILQRIAS